MRNRGFADVISKRQQLTRISFDRRPQNCEVFHYHHRYNALFNDKGMVSINPEDSKAITHPFLDPTFLPRNALSVNLKQTTRS